MTENITMVDVNNLFKPDTFLGWDKYVIYPNTITGTIEVSKFFPALPNNLQYLHTDWLNAGEITNDEFLILQNSPYTFSQLLSLNSYPAVATLLTFNEVVDYYAIEGYDQFGDFTTVYSVVDPTTYSTLYDLVLAIFSAGYTILYQI